MIRKFSSKGKMKFSSKGKMKFNSKGKKERYFDTQGNEIKKERYFDTHGNEIKEGMKIRALDDGKIVDVLYSKYSGCLIINATNEEYLKRHPEEEREYYPLDIFTIVDGRLVDYEIYSK